LEGHFKKTAFMLLSFGMKIWRFEVTESLSLSVRATRRGLFTYSVVTGYAKYLISRDTLLSSRFFCV